jgi:hypothetical protein
MSLAGPVGKPRPVTRHRVLGGMNDHPVLVEHIVADHGGVATCEVDACTPFSARSCRRPRPPIELASGSA